MGNGGAGPANVDVPNLLLRPRAVLVEVVPTNAMLLLLVVAAAAEVTAGETRTRSRNDDGTNSIVSDSSRSDRPSK